MLTNWVPTQTLQSFKNGEDSGENIPESAFEQLSARVSAIEAGIETISSTLSALSGQIENAIEGANKREFSYLATGDAITINGGLWVVCGAYRCFEEMTIDFISGYSLSWPSGSTWQITAARADGAIETQNIGAFQFNTTPAFSSSFSVGDTVIILVRNFTTDSDTGAIVDISPAVCSIGFTRS